MESIGVFGIDGGGLFQVLEDLLRVVVFLQSLELGQGDGVPENVRLGNIATASF